MQIVGSKAYYLKNSTPNRARARTEPRQRSKSPPQRSHLSDIARIRNLSNRTDHALKPLPQLQPPKYIPKHSTKLQTIEQKEQQLLMKIYRSKLAESRSKHMRGGSLTVEKHPIAEVNSLEFESMKPTDRYFQQVENIRLAQRLLLAKPSPDIARTSQQKFYQQQQAYRLNISKLSSKPAPRQQTLRRKKWLD